MDRDVAATSLGGLAHDLSLWGLFVQADWVVKLVMIGLLLASVWVWAIIFEKIASIRRANRQADAFEHSFWSGGSLDELYRREGERPEHPIAAVFGAAMREWHQSADGLRGGGGRRLSAAGTQERLDRAMTVTVQREMDRMERWMVFLASVGSVAPFVGLFGTVWGIMNSFAAIAGMQNTNLAVVAPGIAEALFATAIGLVAAIPAVVIYNLFARAVAGHKAQLADAAAETMRLLSRDLDGERGRRARLGLVAG